MKNLTILHAEDDEGAAYLAQENFKRAGLSNRILRFPDGQSILDFLFQKGTDRMRDPHQSYVLLLDIRMPKVDGVEVLRRLKGDDSLKNLPVIMLTTTDDPEEVKRCHALGCSAYIQKPVDYDKFAEAVQRLGLFLELLLVPEINGVN
ncbi:MAG: response regulator [Limisphaerales bacterium]